MAHPFGTTNFYGSSCHVGAEFGGSRVVLVALNGELMPSIVYRGRPLQRTRITLVPEQESQAWEIPNAPAVKSHGTLPSLPRALAGALPSAMRARIVHGEILRDQQGRLYENSAGTIRPLQQVISGPRGEILEITAAALNPDDAVELTAEASATADDAKDTDSRVERRDERLEPQRNTRTSGSPALENPAATNDQAGPYRHLFAEPGQARLVRLGDFRAMLTPQLAHPERLRDAHRLPCYLQLYEAIKAQPLTSLATELGCDAFPSQIQFVTESVSRVLGLQGLPRPRHAVVPRYQRPPGMIFPNERVFRLRVAQDPTAEARLAGGAGEAQANAGRSAPSGQAGDGPQQRKNSIPERFIKPWEFKLTREEALYEMHAGPIFGGALASIVRGLSICFAKRNQLRHWQQTLRGKNFDDQLWDMIPPKGALSHPKIRRWALETLESAGYDSNAMLLEWEIFWRRKGI
jgi:hypothetical protein